MVNIQPQSQQPISDDQELAKVLAGVTQDDTIAAAADAPAQPEPAQAPAEPVAEPEVPDEPEVPETPEVPEVPSYDAGAPADSGLATIKQDALVELRPLIDKLNVSPEEKFDTYLLLLRSTDDQSLIGPAHDTAKLISDEARKAQALLDIIKEIDYLTNPQGQQPPQ